MRFIFNWAVPLTNTPKQKKAVSNDFIVVLSLTGKMQKIDGLFKDKLGNGVGMTLDRDRYFDNYINP